MMRHFFRGSGLVIPFYASMAFFIVIAFTVMTNANLNANPSRYAIAKGFASIDISPPQEGTQYRGEDFLKFIESNPNATLLSQNIYPHCVFLYSNEKNKSESLFMTGCETDYAKIRNNTDDILVNERYISCCLKIGDDRFVNFNNHDYRVAGTFKYGELDFAVPLTARMAAEPDNPVYGHYIIDAGANTQDYVQKLADDIKRVSPETQVSIGDSVEGANSGLIDNTDILLKILVAISLIMLINVFNITRFWINGRRSEMFVLKLSGATVKQSFIKLFTNYTVIVAIALTAGSLLGVAALYAGFIGMNAWFLPKYIISVVITLFLLMIIGLAFNGAFMMKELKTREANE